MAVEAASENRGVTSLVGQTGDLKTGPTAITSSSSKLNRVGRGVVRYYGGLEAHSDTRPAPN